MGMIFACALVLALAFKCITELVVKYMYMLVPFMMWSTWMDSIMNESWSVASG